MWPGEQPPGSGQQHNPYQQPGSQQPNPYQQPGHQQPNPYQQQPNPYGGQQPNPYAGQQPNPYAGQQPPAPWAQPPAPQPQPGGGRTKLVAILAAAAVVVAACVTGVLLLGGKSDDEARPGPTASSPTSATPSVTDAPRSADDVPKPTVAGWKVVVNPVTGVAFDVPADWQVRSKDWITYVTEGTDPQDPDGKFLVGMKAPAVLKAKWCGTDEDRDGKTDYTSLANVGTRGNKGAKSTAEVARQDSANWVYGWYTQPDHKKVTTGPVTSYTTASGITGSVATSQSSGVAKRHKCDTDGKATTFAFKDSDGAMLSWSFFGAKGVSEEVPDATIRKIMRTVRLYDEKSHS
ncbi:hypothetical protein [Streptomyces diastatochromogenes]|uniref:DUF8017 domain-containing protein n=1 Tax=Streptomyces diastatochromogenes TaxID=42236 RepID=A0A233S8E0_STRDA|nr:hypothetical protein [Streptomyces diastatochromogenes]OXY91940.1 hypothetical protein BEK98_28030 [Streptomyces diastatochromogenes]